MPKIYYSQHNPNYIIIPKIGILNISKNFTKGFYLEECDYEENYLKKNYISLDIPHKELNNLIAEIKNDKFNPETNSFLFPKKQKKAFNLLKKLIERKDYLKAYNLANKFRLSHFTGELEKKVVKEFFLGLRNVDKHKARDILFMFIKPIENIYKEFESEYLK